uniref:Uncharacterized protein n=1 Tax=Timema poppense TaxID=170557 RepID=A0A7R9HD63_TIMPO|nr:unnamed protein product [Timema poppensis]
MLARRPISHGHMSPTTQKFIDNTRPDRQEIIKRSPLLAQTVLRSISTSEILPSFSDAIDKTRKGQNEIPVKNLCELKCRPPIDHISIEGDPTESLTVLKSPSYADHPLVVGPHYQPCDFRCTWATYLGKDTSGVFGM